MILSLILVGVEPIATEAEETSAVAVTSSAVEVDDEGDDDYYEKKITVNPTVKKDGKIVDLGGLREIEGCHINKSKLDFLITKAKTKDKNPQYFYTIKKSVFN